MFVNNEIGVRQPIEKIGQLVMPPFLRLVCLQIVSPLVTGFEDLLSLSSSQAWSYSSWKKKICPPSVHSHTHIVYPHLWPISLWWLSNFGCIKYVCYICSLINLSLCLSVCLSLSSPPPTTTPHHLFPLTLSQSLHMSVSLSISLNSWHFLVVYPKGLMYKHAASEHYSITLIN